VESYEATLIEIGQK